MKIMKQLSLTIFLLGIACICGGCKTEKVDIKKVKDLDFTVVEDADMPKELKELIEEKKKTAFKLKYANTEYLYIAVGYGEQETGGYSITVDQLYLTSNAVYINTNLIGPGKEEEITKAASYPYVVVKVEYMDKNVVFE